LTDRQTDRQASRGTDRQRDRPDEANSRFSQLHFQFVPHSEQTQSPLPTDSQ
jgi:hypothetical protein